MRFLVFIFSLFCLNFALAQNIVCPKSSEVRTTEGWALTAQGASVDWDGSLAKDNRPVGALLTMDLTYAVWLDGYVIRCRYNNGELTNIAPIQGICSPKGIVQNCQQDKCAVKCVDAENTQQQS